MIQSVISKTVIVFTFLVQLHTLYGLCCTTAYALPFEQGEDLVPLLYVGDSGGWTHIEAASDGPFGATRAAHKSSALEEYIEYSLGGAYQISYARIDEDNSGNWHVDEWKLQFLDGSVWRDAFDYLPSAQAGWNEFRFAPVVTSRIRVYFKHRSHVEVREVQVSGVPVLPSCTDSIQNQGEEGLDCGGPCSQSCTTTPGLSSRPENASCLAGDAPSAGTIAMNRIWKDVNLFQALDIIQAPGDSSSPFMITSKDGRIKVVPSDRNATEADTHLFLDLRSVVSTDGEGGLLSMAFDPNYATNRAVYVTYTARVPDFRIRLSRFRSTNDGYSLDRSTEQVLFEVPKTQVIHQAGGLRFGPDGLLYMSLGDDKNGPDAADPTTPNGSILRFDVSGFAAAIPVDNPFGNEVYAYGFRNPWRFSFDRLTNDLFVADVGDCEWEEVSRVVKGGFYGWPYREADRCIYNCGAPYLSPEFAYFNACNVPASIIGGFVYRGNKIPQLYGKYVYGDFETGQIWSYDLSTKEIVELHDSTKGVAAFAEDTEGELIYVDLVAAQAFRIEQGTSSEQDGPPADLMATGCFQSLGNPPVHAPGVVPYSVAQPFWSDGAEKDRWFALPNGTSLKVNSNGDFELPPGGVTIKHFEHQGTIFETRFFVRYNDGTYGAYTYKWLDEDTATLVAAEGERRTIGSRVWDYPSRGQCFDCHTLGANFSLGLEARQFNIDQIYPSTGKTANQIATLRAVGLLEDSPWLQLPPFPRLDDSSISSEELTRSYLHVNCSSCHFGEGSGRTQWDARFSTAMPYKKLCNVPPLEPMTDNPVEALIVPRDPDHSTVWRRMNQRVARAMPPIGSHFPDPQGTLLLQRWIDQLAECPAVDTNVPSVPATIEAENYARAYETTPLQNFGGACDRQDGVDMELTGDSYGGQCAVGWVDPGEWLEYDIYVPTTGLYNLVARVASEDANSYLHLELDGRRITPSLNGSGAGWQNYTDRFVPSVALSQGKHTVRVVFDTGWMNLNYLVIFQE